MTKGLTATQAQVMETLCSTLFDGSITPDQFRLLQVYLRTSASSRQLFIQHRNLHGALAAACAYEVLPTHSFSGMPDRAARTRCEQKRGEHGKREKGGPATKSTKRASSSARAPSAAGASSAISVSSEHGTHADGRRMVMAPLEVATKHVTATSLSAASLVTVLVLLTMAAFTPPGRRLFERFTITAPYQTDRIARLTNMSDCEWLDPAGTPESGAELAAGQKLNLAKGLAKIKYRSGVQVILQGPAVLEISRFDQSYLSSGKLTAFVPSNAKGYTVETPNARVVDLGTEFAVEVCPGKRSEVHVFLGCVEAQWLGKSGTIGKTVSLTAGKAARFDFGAGQETIPTFAANEATFHRTLDRATILAAKKASWREAFQRIRVDPELVLYYTFSGKESNQREFANQASAANKQFPCVLKEPHARGLPLVRGKWRWSAALNFADNSDAYLLVDGLVDRSLADGGAARIPLGQTMSLVATVGSPLAKVDAGTDGGRAASDSVAFLNGPILMNRREHSENLDFQLAIFSSRSRNQPGRVEFRLNRDVGIERRVAGNGKSNKGQANVILSEEVDLDGGQWHQIVAVCESLAVRLYCDGNQVGEQLLDEPLALQLEELSIGRGQSVSPEGKARELGFEGLIDDLAVFKRPLKETEIRDLYSVTCAHVTE